MSRLPTVDFESASSRTQELFSAVSTKMGVVPNMMRTMANSPAVLEAYLSFQGTLSHGVLPAKVQQQLALVISEYNRCEYCLSAHTAIGKQMRLSEDELLRNRQGTSADSKIDALLQFARRVAEKRGRVDDDDVAAVREAGYGNAEIAEVVAQVALAVFTNYFNNVSATEVDFPHVHALTA